MLKQQQEIESNYTIRNFKQNQFQIVQKWFRQQSWNIGLEDYKAYQKIDYEGFWIGLLNGKPIGIIGAVKYDKTYGFIGYFYVLKNYRGRGFGLRLWNKGLQRLRQMKIQNIRLEAQDSQIQNYKNAGFKICDRTLQYNTFGTNSKYTNKHIKLINSIFFENLLKYDETIWKPKRERFLKYWINLKASFGVVYEQKQQIKGYGIIRPLIQGYCIGSLFADNLSIAQQIFKVLVGNYRVNEPISFDISSNNLKLVQQCHWERMYTNSQPSINIQKCYALTTGALG